MAESLQNSFDELIPGAASKAGLFLQVVQQRANQENIGLNFVPREVRKTKQMTLEAKIQFGGTFLKGAPLTVVVHADPIGSSLQVGWQLTEEQLGEFTSLMEANRSAQVSRQLRNLKPENQRALSGILSAFHLTIFMPTLHQLVEALESANRPQGGSGFLGA